MKDIESKVIVFKRIIQEIYSEYEKYLNYELEVEIDDDMYNVTCPCWEISFSSDNYFNVSNKGGWGIDKDSLELIYDISVNYKYILEECGE